MDNILLATNVLRDVKLTINDTVEIDELFINDFEIKYSAKDCKVVGIVTIKNLVDIERYINLESAKVNVYYRDYYNVDLSKDFIITDYNSSENGGNKFTVIFLQDLFSWTLSRSFNSYSFSGNVENALGEFLNGLGLGEYPIEYILSGEEDESDQEIFFTIPKGENNLDSFKREMTKSGLMMYQDRMGVKVMDYTSSLPANLKSVNNVDVPFITAFPTQHYQNKIFDYVIEKGKSNIPTKMRSFKWNISTKTHDYLDIDIFEDIKMNDGGVSSFKEVYTGDDQYQTSSDFEQSKLALKTKALETNKLHMVVQGLLINDVNKVYYVKIMGMNRDVEGFNEGVQNNSGYYVGLSVTDKYMSKHIIQKIELGRAEKIEV